MKLFTILLFSFAMNYSWGQLSSSQRWEKAQFESKIQGKKVFQTTFILQEDLNEEETTQLQRIMFDKEGIVDVERIKPKVITVSHVDFVDFQTIKDFILQFRQEFSSKERKQINFD